MNPEQPQPIQPVTPPVAVPVATPAPAPVQPANPGKTLGIVSFILSLFWIGLVGLILGIIAKKKSKSVGLGNGFAVAGIVLGIINVVFVAITLLLVAYNGVTLSQKCSEFGVGTHVEGNVQYVCSPGNNASSVIK
jgi:hypothetical protein